MELTDEMFDKMFNVGFGTFGVVFIIGIIVSMLVSVAIIALIFTGIKGIKKNNKSPRLTVPATIISKRTRISNHSRRTSANANDLYGYSIDTHTWYYVSFQLESGDRMEFIVPEYEFGLLVEGDSGTLTFQGTRYLSFDRS